MPKSISVHLLPTLVDPQSLRNQIVVVIDILRATTTILHALAAGVTEVIPKLEIEEARQEASQLGDGVLLGGERHGTRIPGFDLDNSPWNYTPERCQGQRLVFTTTNGTRALDRCCLAGHVYPGAFSNLTRLCQVLAQSEEEIHLICAGTDGEITLEDVLFAGLACRTLQDFSKTTPLANDSCQLALSLVPDLVTQHRLVELFKTSLGGKNLVELGYHRDLDRAAEIDRIPILAEWDSSMNRIRSVCS